MPPADDRTTATCAQVPALGLGAVRVCSLPYPFVVISKAMFVPAFLGTMFMYLVAVWVFWASLALIPMSTRRCQLCAVVTFTQALMVMSVALANTAAGRVT